MAFKTIDRVRETTTTVGTGAIVLDGAVIGFQSFSAHLANGDTCDYCMWGGAEWEVGTGTWQTGNTLARTTVIASSNADALVVFSAGTKDVYLTITSALAAHLAVDPMIVDATQIDLIAHEIDPSPHPAYDDMGSLTILFENRLT